MTGKHRNRITSVFFAAVFICAKSVSFAADPAPAAVERDELFYTYAGLSLAPGMSMIHRKGWSDGRESTKDSTGWYLAPGLLLDIYVRNVCGEFSWQYAFDQSADKATSFSHSVYTATGKYIYNLDQRWDMTAGGGFYFEGPPAAKEHGGAGGEISLGTVYTYPKYELKFVFDLKARYGFYGQDAKSTRFGTGIFFGVTKKIGRS